MEDHVQIILPCTNEGEWLRFTVDSILERTRHPSFEVRVVANGHRHRFLEGMGGGGMAVFTRAETFHRLGCYDPEVGGWYPETLDYCIRAWMLGHPMLIEPRIRVLHRRKTESRGYPRRYLDLVHGVLRTTRTGPAPRRYAHEGTS